jgi:CrcB protein
MMPFTTYLLIGFGGMMGSMLRYGISTFFKSESSWMGTGLINILGSFIIGMVMAWTAKDQGNDQIWKWFLATGICGGFTTFSTFSWENLQLVQTGRWGLAFCYAMSSILLGLIAVWFGYKIMQSA